MRQYAAECGFELAGVAAADPHRDFARFETWRGAGFAADMSYLTDRRGDVRSDPKNLLASAQSIICVGKLYKSPERGPSGIASYAWGDDYHDILRSDLRRLAELLAHAYGPFESRICVDTAPLLERSFAESAGLGWIGKNTCLINQRHGSWFFLAEILVSLPLVPDSPPPNRCGTCRRCIDACPTGALVEDGNGGWMLSAARCISYLTIENRGDIPDTLAGKVGDLVFGCDICQDVCPWNRRATVTQDSRFLPRDVPDNLTEMADLEPAQFRELFRKTPVWRARYQGFLRNVAVALGNTGQNAALEPLLRLAAHPDDLVRHAAAQSLARLAARIAAAIPN